MRVIVSLWVRNLKTFARNRVQLIFTLIAPFFFMYIFSSIFSLQSDNPMSYMLAGIIIVNAFGTALALSSSTITDIVSGFMKEVLVSPVKRSHIAVGQLLAAATIAVAQSVPVMILGWFLGLRYTNVFTPLFALVAIIAIGFVFGGLGLFLASVVKNAQTYQVVGMVVQMPMMFLCGAYVPLAILPAALQKIAYFNPLTYTIAFFRAVILEKMGLPKGEMVAEGIAFEIGGFTITPLISMFIVIAFGALFLTLSAIVFTRVDFSRINRTKLNDADIFS
ncbi:MAG: ABC transporter permease [Oscillospiraceae bacterium]|nr:ABC transporter permease [Oscillospiraceae bacterium]